VVGGARGAELISTADALLVSQLATPPKVVRTLAPGFREDQLALGPTV
jgi:hypothetical protein